MRARTAFQYGFNGAVLLIAITVVLNAFHVIRVPSDFILPLLMLLLVLVFTKPLLTRSRKIDLDRPHG